MSHIRGSGTNSPYAAFKYEPEFSGPTPDFSVLKHGFIDIFNQQKNAVSTLQRMLLSEKIPNALLFTGNPGTGKEKAALFFAMAINCKNQHQHGQNQKSENKKFYQGEPCKKCISCKKILSGMHPDIITISPEKNKIKISKIRNINSALVMQPNEAEMRMVLIKEAEKMNKEAENALLKILEEPPEKTFFILISCCPENILPTIISRCQNIKFINLSRQSIKSSLVNEYGIDPAYASIAAEYSEGSITRAFMFVNMDEDTRSSEIDKNTSDKTQKKSPDWIKTRQWLILETSHLITDKHKNNTANSATAIAMAEKIGNQSDYIDETIFILKTWLRDMLVFKYCPDKIINRDFLPFLKDIADNVGIKEIILWFKTLNDAENRIRSNSSVRLSLECFFLKLIFPSTV